MRLWDKCSRIRTLLSHPRRKPQNESLRDSFTDASVYGAIGQVVLDGSWPVNEPLLHVGKPATKKTDVKRVIEIAKHTAEQILNRHETPTQVPKV